MKITYYLLTIPTIAIAYCFFGCTPKPDKYNISQEARDYLCYKQGSYWIYKNDSTNVLDSIYVTNYEEHTENYSSDGKLKSISQIINIYFINKDKSLKLSVNIEPNSSMYRETNYKINQSFNDYFVILKNGNINSEINSKNDYSINGITYKNVIYINHNSSFSNKTDSLNRWPYFWNNEYWVSNNNFIIKKILHYNNATQSWSLVRSHIVQ